MERETNSDQIEKLADSRNEDTVRLLGALGLYDASQDYYEVTEHPEDDQWIIKGEK